MIGREVGLILHEPKIAARVLDTFDADWSTSVERLTPQQKPTAKAARKAAKAVAKGLPSMDSVLQVLATGASPGSSPLDLDPAKLEKAVKVAVKSAVEQSILAAVEEASEMAPGA